MAFEIRAYPDFSWSQSRRSTFRECPRKYYWHYYGSHNGWLDEATAEARQAWRLKKITNLYMVLGTIVHELAAEAVLGYDTPHRMGTLVKQLRSMKEAA